MENEIAIYEIPKPLALSDVKQQVNLIQTIMKEVMHENEHFGVIPGTNKPSLLKAGAEKLIMTFRLVPDVEEQVIELGTGHREVRVKVRLYTQNQIFLGAGVGSCSTMEGKFRFRKADLICPDCGQTTIIKGKAEFGGGWLCYQKKGGCGKKWTDKDNPFGDISQDKVEHDNPADYYNTVLKMAKKRALIDACLTVTAASDIFTQDVEDMPEVIPGVANSDIKVTPPLTPPQGKSTQIKTPQAQQPNDKVISTPQAKRFYAIAKGAGWQDADLKQWLIDNYTIDSTKNIKIADYDAICEAVKSPPMPDPEGCTKNPATCEISIWDGTGNNAKPSCEGKECRYARK